MADTARAIRSTYRVQLTPDVGFDHIAAIVPYVAELGVSALYLSPILEAAKGSRHGYDVIDHSSISAALGGRAGFERLVRAAHDSGLAILIDIVPNHMSIADPRNAWWWDVLENGPSARSARAFDVDWDAPERWLKNLVLLPVLGDRRGRLLERGEIRIVRCATSFEIHYGDHRFPVGPRSIARILTRAVRNRPSSELAFFADVFAELPLATSLDPVNLERRHRDRVIVGRLFHQLLARSACDAGAVDAAIAAINENVAELDEFLDAQNYRLAFWRAAERELDYRRFFDVTTLIGLRVEDPFVFAATHRLIAELVRDGLVDGLRVDHVDGLSDPAAYLRSLRATVGGVPIYVEKILASGEELRAWPIEGTTGYEFLNQLTALFTDPRGEPALAALAAELACEPRAFRELAAEARSQVLDDSLDSELRRLAATLASACDRHVDARDFTRFELHAAVRAVVAGFPIYRSYVAFGADGEVQLDPCDTAAIAVAIEAARAMAPDIDPALFDVIGELLTGARRGDAEALFVRRFQQLTPPATAKGVEDTAFYRDARLLALDEVGGDPARFSLEIAEFHRMNRAALATWPARMLATSTHDTKRSEDVRARLVGLAEAPEPFARLARWFFAATARQRDELPDGRLRLIALQTLIGAWPIDADRLAENLVKAAREAKVATSWARVDERYEQALRDFARAIVADRAIAAELSAFVTDGRLAARTVSLAWTLLKLTCPGIPDIYQGTELWRHDLVDPDNRRPVDWKGAAALRSTRTPALGDDDRGATKQALIGAALTHRAHHAACFAAGSQYVPLAVVGPGARHVIAFARVASSGATSVVVVPRFPRDLGSWAKATTVRLPHGVFRDVLVCDTEGPRFAEVVSIDALFARLPVALVHGDPS